MLARIIPIIFIGIIVISKSSLIFELRPGHQKCYIDELFEKSVLMIKWKIYLQDKIECPQYLPGITISVYNDNSGKKELEFTPQERKSKTTFKPKKEGSYRICAMYKGRMQQGDRLLMNIIRILMKIYKMSQ